jgi:hypothetical protein
MASPRGKCWTRAFATKELKPLFLEHAHDGYRHSCAAKGQSQRGGKAAGAAIRWGAGSRQYRNRPAQYKEDAPQKGFHHNGLTSTLSLAEHKQRDVAAIMKTMSEPSAVEIQQRLRESYALDRLWRETMGLPPGDTKEEPLRCVTSLLEAAGTPYAVIGGIAVQLHSREPRTTLDIDLAVPKFDDIPTDALARAGFEHEGRYEHSDNWRAPGPGSRSERTAVQFSAEDVGIAETVARARHVDVGGLHLRLATAPDLLVLKLAAAEEPTRRPTKRRQDLLDVITLAEEHSEAAAVVPDLRERVAKLAASILTIP